MFCKKLCCDSTIHLVTINFQICIPYSVAPCIDQLSDYQSLLHGSSYIVRYI
jgi:hypothetical protein